MVFTNLALELEILGSACKPIAGGLAGAGVVVLDAARDGVQVVELAALAELADVEDLAPTLRTIVSRVEETSFGARKELPEP